MVLVLAVTGLFLPVRKVSIEPYGILSLETKITLTVGEGVAYAMPDTERQSPDAILEILELSPNNVSYIQDDPDSPDVNWLVASGNNVNTDVRVSFPTPTGSPTVGADLQEFRALVRQFDEAQTGTPTARIELWVDGVAIPGGAGPDTNVPQGGVVLSFTWDANELSTADGSLVECKVVGTKAGGPPTARNTVDVGAVEWNVTYTPPTPDISNSPNSKNFNVVAANSDYWSSGSTPTFPLDDSDCYFTVTNNSGGLVDITIKATSFTGGVGWTLTSGSPGENTVRMKAGKSGDVNEDAMVVLSTSDQSFITGLADQASKKWEINLETGTFTDSVQKSSTITLTATLS